MGELEEKFLEKLEDIMHEAEVEQMVERCPPSIHYDSEAILELAKELHEKLIILKELKEW